MPKSKLNNQPVRLVLCTLEDQQGDSLTVGKVYLVIYDSVAESRGYVRIVDDSGEDFLYSGKFFVPADLPLADEETLLEAREQNQK